MATVPAEIRSSIIEKLTLGVVKSLEKRQGVCEVVVDQKGPVDSSSIHRWESTHSCTLPDDLKDFFLTTDGFLLTWKVKLKDELLPIGRMEINPLSKLDKISCLLNDANAAQSGISSADIDLSEEDDPNSVFPHFDNRSRIFEIDPCLNLGKMCLVYRNTKQGVPANNAEYWFIDKALRWHFIANTFHSYFRLMLTNLGLPQWQYRFTDIGVIPSVQQWYHLYIPMSTDLVQHSADQISGETIVNVIDSNRVFKGKEKKKPSGPSNNPSSNQRKKAGSPSISKNQSQKTPQSQPALSKAVSGFSAK